MPVQELTSSSDQDVPIMEQTSASEVDEDPPKRRARGRGRGSGRGIAASHHQPKAKKSIRKPRARKPTSSSVSWLQPPTTNADDDEEKTSVSDETARIADATKRTRLWEEHPEELSSQDEAFPTPMAADDPSTPKTSGAFDYAAWLLGRLTPQEREKLSQKFTWVDLCAGLGSLFVACEALRRSMQQHGLNFKGVCQGLTEASKERRAGLRRRALHAGSNPPIFPSTASLTSRMPEDDQGNIQDLPIAEHCFMGIVCVDISACSSTPKSLLDESGASGQCWSQFLAYLDLLNFEERPKTLVLECVDNLDKKRAVQGRLEKGTALVIEALKERGYVGGWRKVSPTQFFLPQRRPRVWALFLKVLGGIGPKALQARERDLDQAFSFIQSCQTASHEPLEKILDRTPMPHACKFSHQQQDRQRAQRRSKVPNFQHKHGLSDDEVQRGQDDFLKTTTGILLPRQQEALWLELCKLRKKGHIPNWKAGLFVSDCGSSLGWLSVTKSMFPCIRPGNAYVILDQGQPKLASGPQCLAMQGIGVDEADAFGLLLEGDGFLRQLAGNAFCANICLVFLLAALLHS